MAFTPTDDLFDDEDLLDFEDPKDRDVVAARMRRRGRVPAAITTARLLMYLQLVLPLALPFVLRRGGRNRGATEAAATTTTTIVQEGARRGGGGGGLVIVLGILLFFVAVLVVATKLGKGSSAARVAAIGIEGLFLLLAVRGLLSGGRGIIVAAVLGALAAAVIALLLSPQARKMSVNPALGDASTRFDVRNLPGLDA